MAKINSEVSTLDHTDRACRAEPGNVYLLPVSFTPIMCINAPRVPHSKFMVLFVALADCKKCEAVIDRPDVKAGDLIEIGSTQELITTRSANIYISK